MRVLATSREGLDVEGEHIAALRSMSLADSSDVDLIVRSDAVRLFEEHARSVREGFRVDATSATTVDELCRRLDGIPLAIVLAASRVASLGVPEILALLDERFRLLTGGRRVALERHQTLRAAVDWSYSLLQADEAVVFTRLAVFAGSFDARATRAIVADDAVDEWAVLDAIDGLVRKSMVVAEEQADGSVRYQLLETLRQYARERLEQQGKAGDWRRRHADYFVRLSEETGAGLMTSEEFAWRARLDLELDNLRAATQWAFDAEDVGLLKRVVFALYQEPSPRSRRWVRSRPGRSRSPTTCRAKNRAGSWRSPRSRRTTVATPPAPLRSLRRAGRAASVRSARRPHCKYYVGGITIARVELMRTLIEVRRSWPEAELEAAGASPADLAHITWGFVPIALSVREFGLARVWAERGYELARRSGSPSSLASALLSVGHVASYR